MSDNHSNENTCVVCFKNVEYYSVGECDHPVCFECSTRMRVLCLQNECPICRQALSRVVFTETVKPYKELRNQVFTDRLFERQFKIGFCNEEIRSAYEGLLENRCRLCEHLAPFRNFSALSDHIRKAHERYFCDLCVKHLKIFIRERKCYTRQELGHHRRKGDLDDTSHRGHPLCEFCEERFMDSDELYRHLRKEHLYCHLCDADGRNYYYASHAALAQHFRSDHFLCEEGECAGQHLTAVFRTEIDLKAHKANVHGRGLARAAARQARTLELQFNITPHAVVNARAQRAPAPPSPPPPAAAPAQPRIDTRSDEHFPRLSAAPAQPVLVPTSVRYKGPERLTRDDRNFPALDGAARPAPAPRPAPAAPRPAPAAAVLRTSKPSVSIQLHSQPASASNFRLTQPTGSRISAAHAQYDDDDFPSLGGAPRDDHPSLGAGTVQPSKVTLINSSEMQALKKTPQKQQQPKKSSMNSEAFPALSSSAAPAAPPQWIRVSKKDKGKAKPEPPPPPPREPQFNPAADFPTLSANTKPKAKKAAPAPVIPASQPPEAKPKKEKKKNANKKENISDNNLNYERKPREPAGVLASFNNNYVTAVSDEPKSKTASDAEKQNGGNGDFAYASTDYPPLKDGASARSAPPGFARPAAGLTFTNSAGQTFAAPLHAYVPPPDFERRNRALVRQFEAALGGSEALDDFKVASRAFRDSVITADEFYGHCRAALGARLDDVLPEMVALLPDIGKQQELAVGRGPAARLDVCATCGQLLAPADAAPHDSAHWPALAR